ncbi:MAG TPA: hypothetical protein VEA16_06450 [Vicinamibacterales bacterium]|nr:hypothetical protein [Vicinamibacterales bacterium]
MGYLDSLTRNTLTKRVKVDGTNWTLSAGTSDANSSVIDTAGYDGVRFIIGFGAITSGAVTSIKVQQGADSGLSDAADLEGSAITVADDDDNQIAITELLRPQERYVRLVTDRGTQNAVVDFLLVELFKARSGPVTQDTSATVIAAEVATSPAEGTA